MFFQIRNLRSTEVVKLERPWEWDTTGIDFDIPKEEYRRLRYYDATANHCLVSLTEGLTPSLRVSAKRTETQNPPYRVYGVFGDYDGVFADPAQTVEILRREPPSAYRPAWWVYTQSRKLRLVWLFAEPIRVVDLDHANKLIADVALRIQAYKWGSDYDKKASESCTTYFDIGRKWTKFSDDVIPADILHLWDYEVFAKIRQGYASVTTNIPFDVIQQEIRERWPGRFNGTMREGEHCCRFWDPDSDNERGCMVVKDGIRVFVPHDKPFMTWRDIFGPAFVDKFVSSKVSPVVQRVWWESSKKQFWRWSEPLCAYVPRNETTLKRDLAIEAGLRSVRRKGEETSEIDQALHDITTRREVTWAAPILFQPHGPLRLDNGEHTPVLNTSLVRVTAPSEPWTQDWRWDNQAVRAKFPFIHGLVSTLFASTSAGAANRLRTGFMTIESPQDNIQLRIFLSWLAHFYRTSAVLRPSQGQCLVLAGPAGVGKSFLIRQVVGPLMGGYNDADDYFIGNAKFTGDIVRYPVLGIDDKICDLDRVARAGFVTRLKSAVATGVLRYEEKFQSSVQALPWLGRVVIMCNLDSRSLSVLPDLEQSNTDKITMLRTSSAHYDFHQNASENRRAVAQELPHFARFLLQSTIDEPLRDTRFGVRAYQHPEMVQAASENGYTRVVIDSLNAVIDSFQNPEHPEDALRVSADGPQELRGSSRVLFDLICSVSPSAAREIGGARFLAQQLDQLVRGGYHLHKERKRGSFEWVVPYDFDKDALKDRPEDEEVPENDVDTSGAYREPEKETR